MKEKVEENKAVFLRGLDIGNHRWVKIEAKRRGYTLSGFINHIFKEARRRKW